MGAGEALQAAATLRVQNLLLLCQQLHLPVQYKVRTRCLNLAADCRHRLQQER